MAEGARLESVYTVIPYRGFDSPSHRHYESSIKLLFSFMGSLFFSQLLGVPCFPQQLNGLIVHCHPSFEQFMSDYPILCCLAQLVPRQIRKSLLMFMLPSSFRQVTPFDAFLQLLGISNVVRLAFNLISCSYGE